MIQVTSFLGFPLRTQMQRRLFVLCFLTFVLMLTLPGLIRGTWHPWLLLVQVLNLTTLLGGLRAGGPIKPFEQPSYVPSQVAYPVQTLDIAGRGAFDKGYLGQFQPLDERETFRRDRGHYLAYRVLRAVVGVAALAYWIAYSLFHEWLMRSELMLLWLAVLLVMSLPQMVLLWTEPDIPVEATEEAVA